MIRRTVHRLRKRPEHHRRAIAGGAAVGVVALLLVGWMFVFVHSVLPGNSTLSTTNTPAPVAASTSSLPAAAGQASFEWEASGPSVSTTTVAQ